MTKHAGMGEIVSRSATQVRCVNVCGDSRIRIRHALRHLSWGSPLLGETVWQTYELGLVRMLDPSHQEVSKKVTSNRAKFSTDRS